ncbi:MAG: hypothetical protein IPJ27_19260 [Candidatus Accumulibacter sp.]|uniref:Uncharacterized protein n=1 Tax=Candidatus Accumulibacter proximus TaxID=2954385 RepID=A0A935Q446_9PROT|nr:hypothetical protein [Candidatus Accumulibacter proximus]
MNDFTIVPTADTAVRIGDSFAATNQVGIEVDASPQLPAGTTVRVTVTVGCGAKEADLLASRDEFLKVTGESAGKTVNIIPAQNPSAGKRAWDTGTFPTALPVSISLKGFVSNTPPGDAEIEVLVETSTGRQQWSTGGKASITVKKELEPREEPGIRYFTVNPSYILHAGQTAVTVSFCATGYETLTLFRNNEEVGNWPAQDAEHRIISGSFPVQGQFPETEKPSITSVYRLEGKYTKPDQTEVRNALDRTVQVISPGWNRIALPQGSPVRLFVANDFSGSGSDRLYGIFRNVGGSYALHSSATGVDAWRLEPGDVPQHMATSPGIYYKNKLWLIGGSSVDPDSPLNQVWCYEADQSWTRKGDFPSTMPARMGHACLVFQDTLWVIGGYNNGTAYRDVWQGKEKPMRSSSGLLCRKRSLLCQERALLWPSHASGLAASILPPLSGRLPMVRPRSGCTGAAGLHKRLIRCATSGQRAMEKPGKRWMKIGVRLFRSCRIPGRHSPRHSSPFGRRNHLKRPSRIGFSCWAHSRNWP